MTTLAVNSPRSFVLGEHQDLPVIASDIIYEGAAVGENGSGYFRPLVALDPFAGFAESKADNSAGAAGAINVRVKSKGRIILSVTCLLYTSDAADDLLCVDLGGRRIIKKKNNINKNPSSQ